MFGHPVQLRTSSRRPDCSLISSFLAGAQFGGQKSTGISTELQSSDPHTNSCKFVHPFKFTLTKFLQNARRSSIAVCPMDEQDRSSSTRNGRAPSVQRASNGESLRYLQAESFKTCKKITLEQTKSILYYLCMMLCYHI